ncbi:MAG: helix-turn-helix domain-containing protein [Ferruginibacter sp.]
MSSNFQVQRVCQHCGNEFTARTTVTKYCSHKCANAGHKAGVRAAKIEASNQGIQQLKSGNIEHLKTKEFLTVRDVASLLNCSLRTVYYYIESGDIEAVNLGQRITRVKRSALDKLFDKPQAATTLTESKAEQVNYDISDCYSTEQVREKYGISESALRNLIIKNQIPKFRKGWFAYVPKTAVDTLLC